MTHIETNSLDELNSRRLSDRETSLYYIMAMVEESDDVAEIMETVENTNNLRALCCLYLLDSRRVVSHH